MTDKNHTKFEEKELRFRQTLSALPDGVVLLRKDLVIQWMNRIAERDLSFGFGYVSRHDDCVFFTGRNHANF